MWVGESHCPTVQLQRKEIHVHVPGQEGVGELPEVCPGPRAHFRELGRPRHGNLGYPSQLFALPTVRVRGLPTLGHTLNR